MDGQDANLLRWRRRCEGLSRGNNLTSRCKANHDHTVYETTTANDVSHRQVILGGKPGFADGGGSAVRERRRRLSGD
jgi:hypothetical protein